MTTIAYICKMYPRFSETFIVNEILELERQGLEVRIYSLLKPNDGRFHSSLARVKATAIYAPENPFFQVSDWWPAHQRLRQRDPRRYFDVLSYALTRGHGYAIKRFLQAGVIAAHLLRHPVDGMHAHFASSATRVANFVQRLIGLPYSFTAHAKDIFHEEVNFNTLRSKMAGARFVVTVSDFNRDYLRALMGETPADVRRLYNGIDLQTFRAEAPPQREAGLILGVGRLIEKKGFEDLLQACAILAQRGVNFRCEVIGKGALEERLKELIGQLELETRVHLVGAKPQDEVLAAYQQATIFALPCVIGRDGNRDGLPTVLLEAMACGLPVVSTDVTGVPEIIDHELNGLIVSQHDPEALADAFQRLLESPELRARFAQAAREKVEREFNVQTNVATLHHWLAEPLTTPVSASSALLSQPSSASL